MTHANGDSASAQALPYAQPMRPLPLLTATLVTLALAGCAQAGPGAEPTPTPTRSPMFTAMLECGLIKGSDGVTLGDDETSLVLDTGESSGISGATAEATECVLRELGMPDATWNKIETTRALDGRQDDEWDGYSASWTYHPDDGLNVTVETAS
jgi:hypothetical protein